MKKLLIIAALTLSFVSCTKTKTSGPSNTMNNTTLFTVTLKVTGIGAYSWTAGAQKDSSHCYTSRTITFAAAHGTTVNFEAIADTASHSINIESSCNPDIPGVAQIKFGAGKQQINFTIN